MGVLVIADSHGQGLAPRLKQRIPGVTVSAVPSTTTKQWINYNPSGETVVVVLGTNDISAGRPSSETAAAARQIVTRAGGRRVLWALPPLYNQGAATLNAIRQSGAEIIESLSLPLRDGWHSTAAGYQQWADVIADRVGAGFGGSSAFGAGAASLLSGDSATPSLLIYALGFLIVIKLLRG